jgi:hypothetical protein
MSWVCPHCGTTATLQSSDISGGEGFSIPRTAPDTEAICLSWSGVRCPSKRCGKYVLDVEAVWGEVTYFYGTNRSRSGKAAPDAERLFGIGKVRFEPRVAMPLSKYVPQFIKSDYEEALPHQGFPQGCCDALS